MEFKISFKLIHGTIKFVKTKFDRTWESRY